MHFIAATNNAGKMKEFSRILQALGHTVESQRRAGVTVDPEETGTTFAENALIKAKAVAEAAGGSAAVIADDSGLCVDALHGAPGVYSARYCGCHGDDEANNDKLLAEMQPFAQGQRTAAFVSAVCVYLPDGRHATYLGECPGTVGFARAGTNGFGYDPLFIPTEVGVDALHTAPNTQDRTYAQLTADEKDAISHRGKALRLLQENLDTLLADKSIIDSVCGAPTPRAEK